MVKVSSLVHEVLTRKSAEQNVSNAKKWFAVFIVILGILIYDIRNNENSRGRLWWMACIVACVFTAIILTKLLWRYVTQYFKLTPMEVTEKQRSLLSIDETDMGFKPATPQEASSTPVTDKSVPLSSLFLASLRTPAAGPVTPMNMSAASWASPAPVSPSGIGSLNFLSHVWGTSSILRTPTAGPKTPMNMSAASWASPSPNITTPSPMASPNVSSGLNFSMGSTSAGSVTANSWVYHCNQSSVDTSYGALPQSGQQQMYSPPRFSDSLASPTSSNYGSPTSAQLGSPITDEEEFKEYLHQFKEKEKLRQIMSQSESNNSINTSLWAYGASPHSQVSDYSNLLRKNVYQVATKDSGQETNSADSKNDDSKALNLSSSSVGKIWRKRNVTPEELFQFTENLRIWMSANLLVPLVQDIDNTNKALGAAAPEIQIGSVGVDKLKKTAQNISGVKQLANIVPFLDVTVHQDYLVHRLRELSVGGAISAYRWNGGSSTFNGKPWKDEYPTDTAILLHLFAMYMDRQLPPDIQQPEGRMFSSTHVIKAPEKPTKPSLIPLLYLSQVNPPHLKVVLPPEEECEVGSGRNNFIHALLLFIHHVTHQQHSRIANINLTMSGVNLSWVVRKS
ncbi:hypothetical protein SK128_006105 [Halocaridina rubra]|uniref:Transmembrane protein 209 n=1 Tax=Halocaridina rubra TaxID=373956 RepID=A0AAN8WU50_HALRR